MVEEDAGYAGLSDTLVDLRVDDHARPIEELQRLYGIHQALFGRTPREEWVEVDAVLTAELASASRSSGTTRNCRRRSRVGPAARTWKSGSTGSSGSTRSSFEP